MAEAHEYAADFGSDVTAVWDVCLKKGTIISIDRDAGTASVEIDGIGREDNVPIFYHCQGRNDTEGGHTAFSEEDSVLVLAENSRHGSGESYSVVGFQSGLKECPNEIVWLEIMFGRNYYSGHHQWWYVILWDPVKKVPITSLGGYTFPLRYKTKYITTETNTVFSDWFFYGEFQTGQSLYEMKFCINTPNRKVATGCDVDNEWYEDPCFSFDQNATAYSECPLEPAGSNADIFTKTRTLNEAETRVLTAAYTHIRNYDLGSARHIQFNTGNGAATVYYTQSYNDSCNFNDDPSTYDSYSDHSTQWHGLFDTYPTYTETTESHYANGEIVSSSRTGLEAYTDLSYAGTMTARTIFLLENYSFVPKGTGSHPEQISEIFKTYRAVCLYAENTTGINPLSRDRSSELETWLAGFISDTLADFTALSGTDAMQFRTGFTKIGIIDTLKI